MSTKEHPYHERSKGLIGVEGGGTEGCAVTIHGEGKYPDGQPQHAVDLGKVRRGARPDYATPEGHRHRGVLRERPSAHRRMPPKRGR